MIWMQLKKEYAVKRKTKIENAEEAVFEENKVQEQEVVLLMGPLWLCKDGGWIRL